MKKFVEKYLKYIVVAVALCSLAYGVYRGETALVFAKAAAICLECVGIG